MTQSEVDENRALDVCFICGAGVTSSEHAPARCFFPEEASYRVQLITVPSCEIHNQKTSSDDEYVRNLITAHHSNNILAFRQFTRKVVKSLKRNKSMLGVGKKIQTKQGVTYGFQFDRPRFDRVIRKIAYALYYDTHRKPWDRQLIVLSKHLVYADLSRDEYGELLEFVEQRLPELQPKGENPRVFSYSILKSGALDEDSIIRMVFYEGFTIWVTIVNGSTTYAL